jgi:hypothetical protein
MVSQIEPDSEIESESENNLIEPESESDDLNNYLNYTNQTFNNYTNETFNDYTNETLNDYIQNRNNFENEMYDYLASSTSFNGIFFIYQNVLNVDPNVLNVDQNVMISVNDDFWDPVVVSYDNIDQLEEVHQQDQCFICTEDKCLFKKLKCCSQILCVECCQEWFGRSVKCPYCYQDLRDF